MAPTQRLKEVDGIAGNRYYQRSDGSYYMTDQDAKRLVAYGGWIKPTVGMGGKHDGFRCVKCGFGAWFRKCSRCGSDCEREA
jgi:hypothetical protein